VKKRARVGLYGSACRDAAAAARDENSRAKSGEQRGSGGAGDEAMAARPLSSYRSVPSLSVCCVFVYRGLC